MYGSCMGKDDALLENAKDFVVFYACIGKEDVALKDEKEVDVKNKESRDKIRKGYGVRNKAVGAAMNEQEATNSLEDYGMLWLFNAHKERTKHTNNNDRQEGGKIKVEWC